MRLYVLLEAAVIASSLSLDAFTAGFAYGSEKIKIPFVSILIINSICGLITGAALLAGSTLAPYLPERVALYAAFAILFVIGLTKLLDSLTKSFIRKHEGISKEIEMSVFNFRLILNLYADPEKADFDESKTISPSEAAALAVSLSLDGAAVGFGAAMLNINAWAVFLWSLATNALAIMIGTAIGGRLAEKMPFNISWISGAALIALAFSKLL